MTIPKEIVISAEAVHSLIVNSAVERSPHFAFVVAIPYSGLDTNGGG
jgi:hypothetical protein